MENIKLKGAKNVRDFGGIVNRDGKRIKPHIFLRGCALDKLSARDIEILMDSYRLRRVIDLRTAREIEERPDVRPAGLEYSHVSILGDSAMGVSHEQAPDRTAALSRIPSLESMYRNMVRDEFSVSQFRRVFELILAQEDGSVLWHCTEGKDRCGLTSALFLHLLDVDMDIIFEDYLKTNDCNRRKARKYYLLILFKTRSRELAANIKGVFLAERSYLEAAFDEIDKLYGGLDAFVENQLGISKEARERFKERCLEE